MTLALHESTRELMKGDARIRLVRPGYSDVIC